VTVLMNPECRDGKCRNCDATGWNLGPDEPCVCPCPHHRDAVAAAFGLPVDGSERPQEPAGATFGRNSGVYTSSDVPTRERANVPNVSSGVEGEEEKR
jgi:hypothetical protein